MKLGPFGLKICHRFNPNATPILNKGNSYLGGYIFGTSTHGILAPVWHKRLVVFCQIVLTRGLVNDMHITVSMHKLL